MTISLKLVAVLICTILTAVTATLILVVSLTFTGRAVDDIGLRYTRLTMTNLRNSVESYLQTAVSEYYGVSAGVFMRSAKVPYDLIPAAYRWTGNASTTPIELAQPYVDDWMQHTSAIILSLNFTREFLSQTCFADGTFIFTSGQPNTSNYFTQYSMGQDVPLINATVATAVFYSQSTNKRLFGGGRISFRNFDCRIRTYYTNLPRRPRACYWEAPYLSTINSAVVGLFCALYNSSDAFLASGGMALPLNSISRFVVDIERTANTEAFIADDQGYLLATTHQYPYENVTRVSALYNATGNETVGPNCMVGSSLNWIVLCRQSVESFPYQPLRDLNRSVGVHPPTSAFSGSLKSGGDDYWFGMTNIRTVTGESNQSIPGLTWTVVVLVPEQDVLAEVVKGRTFSIIIACCIFVVASLVCFLLFSVFLSPLTELEEQMMLAAEMELDEEDPSPSALTEIANMQSAFVTMKTELKRVKQYLPQTLLARDDDDEGSEPAADDDKRTTRSTATRSTARKSTHSNGIKYSKRSGGSGGSGSGSMGLGMAGRLNVTAGITRRKVTVVALNLSKFHVAQSASANSSGTTAQPAEFRTRQEKALTAFKRVVTDQKGVVDSFHGDRFIATFNSCLNNPQHALRATQAVDEVLKGYNEDLSIGTVSVGVASGEAFVGNMGIEGLRRFCTVGPVYSQATVLERMSKLHAEKAAALFSANTTREASFEFYFQAVDVVQLPGSGRASVVFVLESRRNAATNEWMYVIQSGAEADRFAKLNEAYEAYVKGDVAAASGEIAKLPDTHLYGKKRLQKIVQQDIQTTLAEKGLFYTQTMVGKPHKE